MNLIKYGEKYFDEIEIGRYRRRDISASAELNQVSISSVRDLNTVVIRGIKDKRMGIYVVENDNEEKIKEGIEIASKLAKLNDRDNNWKSLPEKQKYEKRRKVCENIKNSTPDIFVDIITGAIRDVKKEDENAVVAGAESGGVWVKGNIMNSHGIDVEQEDAGSYFYLYLSGRKGNNVTPGIFELDVRRDMDIDRDFVIKSCLNKLKKAYNVVRSKNEEATIILEPIALGEILNFALFPSFGGERKVKNTTPLVDKVGEKVISEKISIVDDPFHPLSMNPVIADDEGAATRRNVIFENGIFKGFLWNSYWANIANEKNTGNGIRNLSTGYLGIGSHNIVLDNGNKKIEDIISDMEHGYIVLAFQGAHSSNPDTGDFSVVANPAFIIENGEIKGSTVFMMSGNIYSLLSRVERISEEQRAIYAIARGVFPYISFYNVKVASVTR